MVYKIINYLITIKFREIIERHQNYAKLHITGALTPYKREVHLYAECYSVNSEETTLEFDRFWKIVYCLDFNIKGYTD